jgi:ketosteroid isomerase-like protein
MPTKAMPTKDTVRALLERYCATMNAHDRESWLDCFAVDAVQEDPVGTPPNVGREAIGAFFDANDGKVTIPRIIDHIVLSEDGTRFQSLRAFFDFAELVPLTD